MYSYIKDGAGSGRTAKGVKKSVVKKVIRHENYMEVLFNSQQLHYNMINKVSLSCFDDKRYLLEDGVKSYAYGHYRIGQR